MSKPTLLFRGPVKTLSGYGSHSRDLLKSLFDMDLFNIYIDSSNWGSTPMTALEPETNLFHLWIEENVISQSISQPDIYVQVTVPNEFQRIGKYNIGITAGIETTVAAKSWIDGCNRMDKVITTSTFSRDVLLQTVYNENDKVSGKLLKQHKIEVPHDRKDVGMLIKCFCDSFNDVEDKPALILKTSSATFSVKQREHLRSKITNITKHYSNPPSIYLLFGQLTDDEMNGLYNHPKVKSMVTITKGEGYGRPLLEYTMTGKPVIASNWSGHKDFLPMDKAIMIGGKLVEVDESATNDFILKTSKWFTANYSEVVEVFKIVHRDYDTFLEKSESLRSENLEKFSIESITEKFKTIMEPLLVEKPKQVKLNIPQLTKIEK